MCVLLNAGVAYASLKSRNVQVLEATNILFPNRYEASVTHIECTSIAGVDR